VRRPELNSETPFSEVDSLMPCDAPGSSPTNCPVSSSQDRLERHRPVHGCSIWFPGCWQPHLLWRYAFRCANLFSGYRYAVLRILLIPNKLLLNTWKTSHKTSWTFQLLRLGPLQCLWTLLQPLLDSPVGGWVTHSNRICQELHNDSSHNSDGNACNYQAQILGWSIPQS